MTVDRQHGRIVFCCDGCGEPAGESEAVNARGRRSEQPAFEEMWAALKSEGWRAVKTFSGTWRHYCPECKDD
jgi:hypothetical protein